MKVNKIHQSQQNEIIPTVFLTSPKVPRVKPRSSGSCDDVEFPIAYSQLSAYKLLVTLF